MDTCVRGSLGSNLTLLGQETHERAATAKNAPTPRPPATPRCFSPCSPSSVVDSCPPTPCRSACVKFAEYEPFTPVTQTVRGLLTDNPIGTHAIVAVAWSAGIAIACYFWAVRLYNRRRAAGSN